VSDRPAALIYSDLCRTVTADGITVSVKIYRTAHDPKWALEVVHEARTATIWDDQFETVQDALEAFERSIAQEGMASFLDDGDVETVH
jgi:hypothetical protein